MLQTHWLFSHELTKLARWDVDLCFGDFSSADAICSLEVRNARHPFHLTTTTSRLILTLWTLTWYGVHSPPSQLLLLIFRHDLKSLLLWLAGWPSNHSGPLVCLVSSHLFLACLSYYIPSCQNANFFINNNF